MEDLGRKAGFQSKNANLEVGGPVLTMDDYLTNTIRLETLFIKGKGQEIWGRSGGSARVKPKPAASAEASGAQNARLTPKAAAPGRVHCAYILKGIPYKRWLGRLISSWTSAAMRPWKNI
jgi:hypothetical protein